MSSICNVGKTFAIIDKLKMVGDNPMGILMMDAQVGQRTASPAGGE